MNVSQAIRDALIARPGLTHGEILAAVGGERTSEGLSARLCAMRKSGMIESSGLRMSRRYSCSRGPKLNQSARVTGRRALDAAKAAEIRRRAIAGEANTALAREYGVSPSLVSLIRTGTAWRRASSAEVN